MAIGDALVRKASTNSAEIEKVSFLPENSPVITYSTIKSFEGTDGGQRGFFYDCCYQMKKRLFPQHVVVEAKAQLKLAWGIYANAFFGILMRLTMIFAVGHKGKIPLASAGLGYSICNVTGSVYVIGITSVCETFFSQAYGAKQMRRYGIILQRAAIITSIAVLPSCALWINVDKLLLYLGQDKEVAILAGQYTIWFIPGIFLLVLTNLLLRYLACQNVVYPSVYSAFAAFIVNGICCYVFVYVCDLGVWGGVLAIDVSYLTYSVVLLIFIFWKKLYKDTWYGLSYECFCDWRPFVSLSASSILLSICEWICFEIGTIVLGVIGSLEQAVQIVMYSIAGVIYFGDMGFSIAAAVRVGHFIGSGEPERAKLSSGVALKLAALYNICIGLLIISLQDVIVYLFTSDRSVVSMASKLVFLVAVVEGFDCLEVVSVGIVRGLGYQKQGALITFISLLCVGTSSSLLLIFVAHLRVPGFWIGAAIGIVVQTVALFALLYKLDWKKVSESVRESVGVVVSAADGHQSQLADNDAERTYLKSDSRNPDKFSADVEYHSNDATGEDVVLIAGTTASVCSGHDRDDESKEICKTAEDVAPHASKISDADVFFVHQSPHLSKLDIFIKISVISVMLCGVAASAVIRIYL